MALGILDLDPQILLSQFDHRWKAESAAKNRTAFRLGLERVRQLKAELV